MNDEQIRDWLGKRFIYLTFALVLYVLLFRETVALPVPADDCSDTLLIVAPFLFAQITAIFQWYTARPRLGRSEKAEVDLPVWLVKRPVQLSVLAVVLVIVLLIGQETILPNLGLGATEFKVAVATAVAMMNASTLFVMVRVFRVSIRKG